MLFNSYLFIFAFFPLTLIGFFLVARHLPHRVAITWLVCMSLLFYGWWNPKYLFLLIFSMLFNYTFGRILSRRAESNATYWKFVLAIGVTVNLGLIGYFKYANFIIDALNTIADSQIILQKIILPLAISFFTFQQIAYLVDAYRGATREYDFIHYCLFVSFFPQLIAGPIVHHGEMIPQFMNKRTYRPQTINIAVGLTIFFVGLFKKVVIADSLALHATPVFALAETGEKLLFFQAWEGALSYTFQLYFDFSGYSDMAIGLARMFGIVLPENFASPYKSTNMIEFWRRWHMTLSRFLKDYLYIPLGGNRKGRTRRYINLMITMVLGGVWHGAGWTYVVWGTLHGLFLLTNHLWRTVWPWKVDRWLSKAASRVLTFFAVVVAWVFFRAESFNGALAILQGMVNLPDKFNGRLGSLQLILENVGVGFHGGYLKNSHYELMAWLVFWLFVVWICPNTQLWMRKFEPVLKSIDKRSRNMPLGINWPSWHPTARWGIVSGLIAVIGILGLSSVTEFLYFQF